MSILKVGNLAAEAGKKTAGWMEILDTGHRLPVTLIAGANPGKTVTVTAGVHGSEYNGIEACIRLARMLEPTQMQGNVILVHVVNTGAFYGKSQYINPDDGKNMGGAHPGSATGTITEKIAYVLTQQVLAQSDFHIDLHSGDLHEDLDTFGWFTDDPKTREESLKALSFFRPNFVAVSAASPRGASSAEWAAHMGIPAILAEIGGCGRWSEHYVQKDIDGVTGILQWQKVLPGPPPVTAPVRVLGVDAMKSTEAGCLHVKVAHGDRVKAGQTVCYVEDLLGRVAAKYSAPHTGEIFCITRSLAIRPGDLMLGLCYDPAVQG